MVVCRSTQRFSLAVHSGHQNKPSQLAAVGVLLKGAYRALCARCAKIWPFSTTGSSVSSEDWKDVIEWLLQWTGL